MLFLSLPCRQATVGPRLKTTDVGQRLRASHQESYASYPNDELQAGRLVIYVAEKVDGTDMAAIVCLLQECVERGGRAAAAQARSTLAKAELRLSSKVRHLPRIVMVLLMASAIFKR